jgi:uncharacterized protein YgiM (DUF1202 family)
MTHRWIFKLAAVILFVSACTSVIAQQQSRQRRVSPRSSAGSAQSRAQEQEQRRRDEASVMAMADPGFDFALVTARQANLREEPSISSPVLMRLQRGAMLAIVDRQPEGTWYLVIHIESATEGWVDESGFVKRFTGNAQPGPRLQAERTGGYEDPEIEVTNDAHLDLNLRVGGTLYIIPSRQKRTISMKAGGHKFYAYAPGVSPAFGEKLFEVGHRYTWRFWIQTTR